MRQAKSETSKQIKGTREKVIDTKVSEKVNKNTLGVPEIKDLNVYTERHTMWIPVQMQTLNLKYIIALLL